MKPASPWLAIVILARNESHNIARAVCSAKKAGRVVVIDAESTDDTREKAAGLGAEIIVRPWPGFAAQRRFALENIRAEWIFFLDADEELSPELAEELREERLAPDGFRVRRKSLFLGRWMNHGAWGRDKVLRLFRPAKAKVPERAVHEEVEITGKVDELRGVLLHYAQDDFSVIGRKFTDYVPLMAAEIRRRGKKIGMADLALRPLSAFLRDFFLRKGFLDGWRGFVLAAWGAASVMAKYAEARRRDEDSSGEGANQP